MFTNSRLQSPRASGSAPYTLYLGHYLDEAIVLERGLQTRNAAGSNRMVRIAEALGAVGQRVLIVSPAVSMRTPWMGQLVHPLRLRRLRGIRVLFSTAVGFPIVSALLEPLFLFIAIYNIIRKNSISTLIIYDFYPSFILIAFFARFLWRIPIIADIEDVSEPRWQDWSSDAEVRPLQQLIGYFTMNALIRLSAGVIIPSERFAKLLPYHSRKLVISGCMPSLCSTIRQPVRSEPARPLNLLFAGKIEFEHGIACLLDALTSLAQQPELAAQFQVEICGSGSKERWLVDNLRHITTLNLHYHGFVSDEEYQHLLYRADICVALQDPHGRYGETNVPSKVYEFLGHGKMVVATDVGDLALLPKEVITICSPYDAKQLHNILVSIADDPNLPFRQGAAAARYVQEHFAYPIVGAAIRDFILRSHPGSPKATEKPLQ
jgi:glycosyltransferase involved in cell wall biosynthesis